MRGQRFFQANPEKIKVGRKYYIFFGSGKDCHFVRVEVTEGLQDVFYKDRNGVYLDLGVRVKRLDNGNHLPRLRRVNELYTRNGS